MFRWLATCVVLCVLTFGVVFLVQDPMHLIQPAKAGDTQGAGDKPIKEPQQDKPRDSTPVHNDPVTIVLYDKTQTGRTLPIVVQPGVVTPIWKQEVPSERQGRVLFLARELRPDELALIPAIDKGDRSAYGYFGDTMHFIGVETRTAREPTPDNPTPPPAVELRPWLPGQPLEADRIRIGSQKHYFHELGVGDVVRKGELLAVVNPVLALDDMDIKNQKLNVAMAEIKTSAATKVEAQSRLDRMLIAIARTPKSIPDEEISGARLTVERYVQEEIAKKAAYVQAQRELNASITQLGMHQIRAQISGTVKSVYKTKGDGVKENETVLQIQDFEHLRVESVMEAQYASKVKVGDEVLIEPAIAESPRHVLNGHLQEVTCVAVTKGEKPLILSGSEDRTVRVWDPTTGDQKAAFEHKAAVRSVACTTGKDTPNLALVGCSDGSARLFDMDNFKLVRELPRKHTRSINCVAFSPDGKTCATGSEDLTICLWNVENGEILDKPLHAHKSPVTSLQFATNDTFVSAGRDNWLNVWKFESGKAPVRIAEFDKRSGDVTHLGVSPDGKYVLFDDLKDLRILSLETRQIVGTIQNSGGTGFKGLAIFAPDGKTVLTTNASESRLQLWRTPELGAQVAENTTGGRASELRQFVWSTGKEDAAAYAPDASFIVTGTQDNQVLVWAMPDKKQIEEKLTGRVSLVEQSLDASSRQVRIWAEVDNKYGWLIPGGTATIVIPPAKK